MSWEAIGAIGQEALGGQPGTFQAALMARAGVTQAEATRIFLGQMIWWQYYAEKVISYAGELSPADRFQADNYMRTIFNGSVRRLWFVMTKATLNPEAVRYVEDLLAHHAN